MEGFKEYQLPLTVIFVDFKKVFDSINRSVMFPVLRHYGIQKAVVSAIQVLYTNSSSAVMVDGGISESFDVTTGVLQGDVLAPFLFVILVDHLLGKACEADSGVVTHPRPAKSLNDPDFADDTALLESAIPRAQSQFSRTADAAADLGLLISAPKTEYMTINCHPQPPLQVYGNSINHVSDFRYLGPMMASSASDLKRRKILPGQLSGNFSACGEILTSQFPPKSDCSIQPASQFCCMAVNHRSSPRLWKTRPTHLVLHVTE